MIFLALPVAVSRLGLNIMAAGFVAFLIVLLVTRIRSGGTEPAGGKRSRRSWFGVAVQMLGIGVVGYGPVLDGLPSGSPLALAEAAGIAALMACVVSLFAWSARTMGRNWSLEARTRANHLLITAGPFARVRHPIYVALFLFMLAIALAFGHYRQLALGVPLYAIGTWLRIRAEEALLRAAFGADYEAYAARVRRFVPGLF